MPLESLLPVAARPFQLPCTIRSLTTNPSVLSAQMALPSPANSVARPVPYEPIVTGLDDVPESVPSNFKAPEMEERLTSSAYRIDVPASLVIQTSAKSKELGAEICVVYCAKLELVAMVNDEP